jgi:hypothetical protein
LRRAGGVKRRGSVSNKQVVTIPPPPPEDDPWQAVSWRCSGSRPSSTAAGVARLQRPVPIAVVQSDVPKFWQKTKVDCKQLSNMALTELHPFASTYLCEASFSAVTELKTKLRNRMSPENDLSVTLSSVKPRFENMI